MKTTYLSRAVATAVLAGLFFCCRAEAAGNTVDAIELIRSSYKGDRQALVAEALNLTEKESAGFWPLYRSYRGDMEKIGDGLVKLVLEYADNYPALSEETAGRLLKQYTALEKEWVNQRNWYLKRAGKHLPASKVMRWAQVENRMDLALRLQLAGTLPLAPQGKAKPQ